MAIDVQTPVFEGPFDLLLHLILREQVDLYEVSLLSIVDAYLREFEAMSQLDLELATEFLLIAATLVDLKARRLLPDLDDGDVDEELAFWSERDVLLARLLECKTFKDAAAVLERLGASASRCVPRRSGPDERYVELSPDALEGVRPERLREAFVTALTPKAVPTVDLFHVNPIRITVVDAVAELLEELPKLGRITFRELTAAHVEKIEIAVRFLAILELVKQGYVDVDQAASFGEIEIVWLGAEDGADLALVDAYEG